MKILLIEDDSNDLDLAQRELRRALPELSLATATSIRDGLAALQNGAQFDVVLTDLRLPDGSGMDVLHAIRQDRLATAVVLLTGQGDEELAVGAIKAGADDYVPKRSDYHKRLPTIVQAAFDRFQAESTRRRGSLRVLYAEHDLAAVEQTRRHLAQHAPHVRVDVVHSGAAVLAQLPLTPAEPSHYDVLLLDFSVPGANALDLLKTIHDERQLDLPVVLITSQGDEEVAVQVLRLGAIDYIVKHGGYLFELPVALENAYYRVCLAREQAALRASEERFRRLAENAPDLIYRYVLVPEPRFEYVSPAAEIVHPDDRHLLEQAHRNALAFDEPLVLRWRRKDGSVMWTEQRNRPVYGADGQLVAFEGIARDVTQNRETMAALQMRLAELEALHNLSNALRTAQTQDESIAILLDQTLAALHTDAAAIWLYDAESSKLRTVATSGWCSSFERAEVALGEGITGTVFTTAKAHMEPDLIRSSRLAEPLKSVTPVGWGAGWAPIRTSSEIVGVLFVALRLPQQVTQEQMRLLVSLAEMAGSILQRLRLTQQREAQAEQMRQIVNTVPEGLALLDGSGCVLLANPAAEMLLRELANVRIGDRIATLGGRPLTELLAPHAAWQEIVYRNRTFVINARPVEPAARNTAWVLMVDEVTKEREHQRYQEVQDRLATVGQLAAGLAHDFNNVLGVISVYADILLIAQNLTDKQRQQLAAIVDQTQHAANLVRQVLDFSRRSVIERSHIDLFPLLNEQIKLLRHTLPENIDMQLQIDYQPHIFEPFFTTKGPGMGTGLGLAQVYGIVKQHDGAIDVTSSPSSGTAFTIFLPLVASAVVPPPLRAPAPARGGQGHILLVEDNTALREALAQSLASLGYHVLSAPDAESALAQAEQAGGLIDLVLSDLVLPGRSGIELFAALQPLHPQAQLVLMTGHPMTETRMQSMQNIHNWIQKPFTLDGLTAKVRTLLDARRSHG